MTFLLKPNKLSIFDYLYNCWLYNITISIKGRIDPLPILWTVERLSGGGLRACLF